MLPLVGIESRPLLNLRHTVQDLDRDREQDGHNRKQWFHVSVVYMYIV